MRAIVRKYAYGIILGGSVFTGTGFCQSVINIPPNRPPSFAGPNNVVNVLENGELRRDFVARDGAVVNIDGGRTGNIAAVNGATVNLKSGRVDGRLAAESGQVVVSGGAADSIRTHAGGVINISGGAINQVRGANSSIVVHGVDFEIGGVPVSGLSEGNLVAVNLPTDSTITATLADGTPFAHYQEDVDGAFTIVQTVAPVLPPAGTITIDSNVDLPFASAGKTVLIEDGGVLPDSFRAGPESRVELKGGHIDRAFHAIGTEVVIERGAIRRDLHAYGGTVITLHGGMIESDARLYAESTLNIHGGTVGNIRVEKGATINLESGTLYNTNISYGAEIHVSGGELLRTLDVYGTAIFTGGSAAGFLGVHDFGQVILAGGRLNDNTEIRQDSLMTLRGVDFQLDGVSLNVLQPDELQNVGDRLQMPLPQGSLLSGTLSDGTRFAMSSDEADRFDTPVVLELSRPPVESPVSIELPRDAVPRGIGAGQRLTVRDGGALPENFNVGPGSTVHVLGGTVGRNFEAVGASVEIVGGRIGDGLDAFHGATVDISGTVEWHDIDVHAGAVANLGGGIAEGGITARPGSQVVISGAKIRGLLTADQAVINIQDGEIGKRHSTESIATGATLIQMSGGLLHNLVLFDGSTLSATGGQVGYLSVNDSTAVEIDGARFERLDVHRGGEAIIRSGNVDELDSFGTIRFLGGAIGDGNEWLAGNVELHGYDFHINGTPLVGLDEVDQSLLVDYESGSLLTGTLSDGSAFAITTDESRVSSTIQNGVVRLIRTAIRPLPDVVNVPSDPAPWGIGGGRTLIVDDGGAIPDHFVAGSGSTVEIRGGTVGNNFEVENSVVSISGGKVGDEMDAFARAVINITGGEVGSRLEAYSDSTVNIYGGRVGNQFRARANSAVNVDGGEVGSGLELLDGASLTVVSGTIDNELTARSGSTVDIHGGSIGAQFDAEANASITIRAGTLDSTRAHGANITMFGGRIDSDLRIDSGGTFDLAGGVIDQINVSGADTRLNIRGVDFMVNGSPLDLVNEGDSLAFDLPENALLSGILADGTPFVFTGAHSERDSIEAGTLNLVRSAMPVPGPPAVRLPADPAPVGVGTGQTLTVGPDGYLPGPFNAGPGSTVVVAGGDIGRNFEAYGSQVIVRAGSIANEFDAFPGTIVTMEGGRIGNMEAFDSSVMNVSGGESGVVGMHPGSHVHVQGGKVRAIVAVDPLIEISGGIVTEATVDSGSIHMSSGRVERLNVNRATADVSGGAVEDFVAQGTTASINGGFIARRFATSDQSDITIMGQDFRLDGVEVEGLTVEGERVTLTAGNANLFEGLFDATLADGTPLALSGVDELTRRRTGDRLVNSTLTLVRTSAPAAEPITHHVPTDSAPDFLRNGQTLVLANCGELSDNFLASRGSQIEIRGGRVGENFEAVGADVSVQGGVIGAGFDVFNGAVVDISGGSIGEGMDIANGSVVRLRGGSVDRSLRVFDGAELHIFGSEFRHGGENVEGLNELGDSIIFTPRGSGSLDVTLGDGNELNLRLRTSGSSGFVGADSIVRLTMVEPESLVTLQPGDADQNRAFDQLDLVQVQQAGKYLSGTMATWGEGDWNSGPGGSPGHPPEGDCRFDQRDITAALVADRYLSGPYAALKRRETKSDEQTSLIYDAATGQLEIVAPTHRNLTSINITSLASRFTGNEIDKLDGPFDNSSTDNIFKATMDGSFSFLDFGDVLPANLSETQVLNDLFVFGSLDDGSALAVVNLMYVPIPEPTAVVLAVIGLVSFVITPPRSRQRA